MLSWFAASGATCHGDAVATRGASAGSDREGRGRLVAALRAEPVPHQDLALVLGWAEDPQRAERVAASLVADGLVERRPDRYVLAGWAGGAVGARDVTRAVDEGRR